jgi:hypothetical protein
MNLGRPPIEGGRAHDCADLETLWCQVLWSVPVGNIDDS